MALFSSPKKKIEKKKDVPSAEIRREMGVIARGSTRNLNRILIRPRITEKATMQAEKNVYTFDVVKDATKNEVVAAVKTLFKVTPVKVSVIPVRSKTVIARGKKGSTRSGKKAYVYLRDGEKIEFV